jgi:hypothetical protein
MERFGKGRFPCRDRQTLRQCDGERWPNVFPLRGTGVSLVLVFLRSALLILHSPTPGYAWDVAGYFRVTS